MLTKKVAANTRQDFLFNELRSKISTFHSYISDMAPFIPCFSKRHIICTHRCNDNVDWLQQPIVPCSTSQLTQESYCCPGRVTVPYSLIYHTKREVGDIKSKQHLCFDDTTKRCSK